MTSISQSGLSVLLTDAARLARAPLLAATLLGSLSASAWAAEVAVPAKNPAVTLTVPGGWTTKEIDDGIQVLPPDEAVAVYVNYGARSELETTLKSYREWMKKQKIIVNTPKESTLDFAGTPGRVVRYDTKTKSGSKTIVDFIILNASRDRFAIVTLWGSTEEREGNEAGLAAIMASVRVAAETGSFWAGNSTDKPATGDKARADAVPPAVPTAPAKAAAPVEPEGPNETRLAAYLFGTLLQKTIRDCDIATTGRQREAIERKMVPLRAEMAPFEEPLKEVTRDMPGCPPPGSEGRMVESMSLFIEKSPEEFAAAMDKAQQAAAATQAAKGAPASAAAAPVTKPAQPYGVRKAVFVTRPARYFGDVEIRPSNVFQAGEVLFSYVEPVGQSERPAGDGQRQAGVTVDMEVRTLSGEVLGGRTGMSDTDITLNPDQSIDTFYLNTDVTLSQLRPGSYTLVYLLKDKLNGRTVEVPQAFSLVSSKAETTSTAPASRVAP